jgi:hypothetical protein
LEKGSEERTRLICVATQLIEAAFAREIFEAEPSCVETEIRVGGHACRSFITGGVFPGRRTVAEIIVGSAQVSPSRQFWPASLNVGSTHTTTLDRPSATSAARATFVGIEMDDNMSRVAVSEMKDRLSVSDGCDRKRKQVAK